MVKERPGLVTMRRTAVLARWLYRGRYVFAVGAIAAAAWLGAILLDSSADSEHGLLALSLLLWTVLALAGGFTLTQVPAMTEAGDGLLLRLRKWLVLAGYWLALLMLLGLSLLSLYLSLRGIGFLGTEGAD